MAKVELSKIKPYFLLSWGGGKETLMMIKIDDHGRGPNNELLFPICDQSHHGKIQDPLAVAL